MSYEVESRGKKMHMNKNIARLAVTAGLTAALSFGGVMAPVTMAFAECVPTVATENGKVFITDPDTEYTDTSFKGIQIFKATVTQNKDGNTWSGDKTLSDIDWASLEVQKAVIGAFTRADGTRVDGAPRTDTSAQAWAKYINDHAGDKVSQTAKVDADSTLDKIAAALEGSNLTWTKPSDSSKGNFESLDQGYWLFVTDVPSKTGNTDAYTSPIFTIVGGSDVNVAPKKSVPNVTKAVKDDNNGSFVTDESKNVFEAPNRVADSASDQLIEYQLAGTVASNINTYKEYSYTFTDVLPSTMVPELNGNDPVVEVKIGDQVVHPSSYNKSYVDGKLEVSFSNLKNAHVKKQDGTEGAVIIVDGSSKVYVNYKARLDPTKVSANMLGKGQKNTVTLTYSNNPHDNNGTGTTVDHPAYDYTYGIDVTKVGSDKDETGEHKTLEGVQFTLQEKGSGKFVKADGTTTSNQNDAILTTTSDGKISVVGLDEGTYILKEVKPAPGYNNSAAGGITFAITNTGLPTNGDSFNPGCDFPEGTYDNLVQSTSAPTGTIDGKVHLTVTDKKGSNLPLTGLNGVTFTWIAGGAVLCIGVAHLIRSRKQAEESEQE